MNNRPLFLVGIVIAVLVLLSIFKINGRVGPVEIKKIDLFSDIHTGKKGPEKTTGDSPSKKDTATGEVKSTSSKSMQSEKAANTTTHIISFGNGHKGSLKNFFEELYRTEKYGGKVRIAYFGDSIIEGDLITYDLRKNLQKTFGGNGVGFVPVTSIAAEARGSIHHRFSGNWQVLALHPRPQNATKLGISGFTFFPGSDPAFPAPGEQTAAGDLRHSWVEYRASTLSNSTRPFHVIKLYYGPAHGNAYASYTLDGGARHTLDLGSGEGVQEAVINNSSPVNKVRIDFYARGKVPIYGLSFEDNHGVYVDNFSIRGYSGITLNKIPCPVYSGFDRYLQYRLVIVHYGINVSDFTTKQEFNWYRKQMVGVINHLKGAFPGASFLVIGVGDIGHHDNMETVTKPSIPLLVEAQYNMARETGAGFWNLFYAMGGENSMAIWAAGQKPLASRDYVHFNARGAKKIADLLTKALGEEYEKFKTRRDQEKNETTMSAHNIGTVRQP